MSALCSVKPVTGIQTLLLTVRAYSMWCIRNSPSRNGLFLVNVVLMRGIDDVCVVRPRLRFVYFVSSPSFPLHGVAPTMQVVAYVWDMHVLREFVKRRPMIGASLQKAISVDLVNKVDQSRDHKEHYRQLLAEALDGGRVTSTERRNLQR